MNNVNMIPNISSNKALNVKGVSQKTQDETGLERNIQLDGLSALAAYKMPGKQNVMKLEPTKSIVLLPEDVTALKGEKILNSAGILHSIVQKDNKTTTIYRVNPENTKEISKILVKDNVSGEVIRKQSNFYDSKGVISVEIEEYEPNSHKIIKKTNYERGALEYVKEYLYLEDGRFVQKAYYVDNDNFEVIDRNPSKATLTKVVYDNKKGKIQRASVENCNDHSYVNYYWDNGVLTRCERGVHKPILNNTGKNPLLDDDLKPMQFFVLDFDPAVQQGQKSFFSNGKLESIKTHNDGYDLEYCYDIDGKLVGVTKTQDALETSFIFNGDGSQTIMEYNKKDDIVRTMYLNTDGSSVLSYLSSKDGVRKTLTNQQEFSGEFIYSEHVGKDNLFMTFDKNGNLLDKNLNSNS